MPENINDTGTAYGQKPPSYKANLVEVGPGTPMGELMRRYWHPFFVSEQLISDKPRRVRLLGEGLILFRDKSGRPGLVAENCCHRGSSLFFGRVEDDGIRCCYHGWKFDVQGHCIEQPAEKDMGRNRKSPRQPWYPVEERYGLIFTYMGPPEKKPVLPRWECFENLGPDEFLEIRSDSGYGPRVGPAIDGYDMRPLDFNWLQAFENTMDPVHLPWLHYHHTGDQFTGITLIENVEVPPYARYTDMAANIIAERTDRGVRQGVPMPGPGGQLFISFNEAMVPNLAVIPGFIDLIWFVPVDDTHFLTLMIWRNKRGAPLRSELNELHGSKTWWQMNDEEHRDSPGDYEAQSSIGRLPAHSREHFSAGDIAIAMLRRRLEEAVKDVAEGRDPAGISFDASEPPQKSQAQPMMPLKTSAA